MTPDRDAVNENWRAWRARKAAERMQAEAEATRVLAAARETPAWAAHQRGDLVLGRPSPGSAR